MAGKGALGKNTHFALQTKLIENGLMTFLWLIKWHKNKQSSADVSRSDHLQFHFVFFFLLFSWLIITRYLRRKFPPGAITFPRKVSRIPIVHYAQVDLYTSRDDGDSFRSISLIRKQNKGANNRYCITVIWQKYTFFCVWRSRSTLLAVGAETSWFGNCILARNAIRE